MRRPIVALALALVAFAATSLFATYVTSVPLYAARTGSQCQTCHFDPNGGGPRTPFGFAYERNRHSLDRETNVPWKDAEVSNQIGDNMPVFLGTNQRFMLLTTNEAGGGTPDRGVFFNMENALSIVFRPHDYLTLVYVYDAFASSPSSGQTVVRDAFGMLRLPAGLYAKAGRFRNPFGLRMDDHTVATRNGYLDFSTAERVLPYDPRFPDMGIEIGGERGPFYGRAAYTNGAGDLLGASPYAETKSVKLGATHNAGQGGVSFYDAYHRQPTLAPKRATRWGAFGMTSYGMVSAIGEVIAGTDEAEPTVPGFASGPLTNVLGWFAEVDVAPWRYLNARLRYDYMNTNRSTDPAVSETATHRRYAFEMDYVPVPFCELRATLRNIDNKPEFGYPDQTQAYLQFHFSY